MPRRFLKKNLEQVVSSKNGTGNNLAQMKN